MSDENTDKPNETTSEVTPDPPKETETPTPPTPPADTDKVTRQEFNGLSESLAALTTKVTDLVDTLSNSNPITHDKPISKPWTHWGSKDNS